MFPRTSIAQTVRAVRWSVEQVSSNCFCPRNRGLVADRVVADETGARCLAKPTYENMIIQGQLLGAISGSHSKPSRTFKVLPWLDETLRIRSRLHLQLRFGEPLGSTRQARRITSSTSGRSVLSSDRMTTRPRLTQAINCSISKMHP
jgi:hypothetical protein